MAGWTGYRDRVAVVTGASSGIGAEAARELARRGMRVALVARRKDRLEALASSIGAAGGEARVQVCDVADRGSVAASAGEILAAWGRVDLLFNNAGYVRHILFKDHDVDDIDRMMRTNYAGVVYWIKAVLPAMRQRGEGWIVNVSSFAGKAAQPDEAAYSASKFAVSGLSEALVDELAPLGIHVLCVSPVLVRTEMFTPEVMERMPRGSERRFIGAEAFVAETLRALERGETDVTIPRRYRVFHVLRNVFPTALGRRMAKLRLAGLPDLTR